MAVAAFGAFGAVLARGSRNSLALWGLPVRAWTPLLELHSYGRCHSLTRRVSAWMLLGSGRFRLAGTVCDAPGAAFVWQGQHLLLLASRPSLPSLDTQSIHSTHLTQFTSLPARPTHLTHLLQLSSI